MHRKFLGRFTVAECERVIALHEGMDATPKVVRDDRGNFLRNSEIFWIRPAPETRWIYDLIWVMAAEFNQQHEFELSGKVSSLQLSRYMAGHKYEWHMDLGGGDLRLRKISIVVELGSGGYDGGGLEVFYGNAPGRIFLRQGDAVVFPSYIMHRALEVQQGVRWSLTAWLTGSNPLQ
jgi:PKHD-type hydroxylase